MKKIEKKEITRSSNWHVLLVVTKLSAVGIKPSQQGLHFQLIIPVTGASLLLEHLKKPANPYFYKIIIGYASKWENN